MKMIGLAPRKLATSTLMKIEPKTFFANERTFLAWLHMAVTVASISAALLGFSSSEWQGQETKGGLCGLVEAMACCF
jgi:uncharacterized membrane protein YidH (DUF202 family)